MRLEQVSPSCGVGALSGEMLWLLEGAAPFGTFRK